MRAENATHAVFRHFNREISDFEEVSVPLAEAEAYQARTHEWVQKVVLDDGTWSWGKSWVFPEGCGELSGRLCAADAWNRRVW